MLRIQYLWIDSLCLVEDQLIDWSNESTQIHDYYRKSHLNIAALDSVDSVAGKIVASIEGIYNDDRYPEISFDPPCSVILQDRSQKLVTSHGQYE